MKIWVFLLVLICPRCSGLFEKERQAEGGGSLPVIVFTSDHRLEKPATQEGMGTGCGACSNSKNIFKKARKRDMVRCKDCGNQFHEECILKWKRIRSCTLTIPNGTVSHSPLTTLFSTHYPPDQEFVLVTIFRHVENCSALPKFGYIYHDSHFSLVDNSQLSQILFLIDKYIHNIKFQLNIKSQTTTVSVVDKGTITKIERVTSPTLSSVVKILIKKWKILPPEFLNAFSPSYANRSRVNLERVVIPPTPYRSLEGGVNYIKNLPIGSSKILFLFLSHARRILEFTKDNKITKESLSFEFAPCLFDNEAEVYVQTENVEEKVAKDEALKETVFRRRCVLEDLILHSKEILNFYESHDEDPVVTAFRHEIMSLVKQLEKPWF